MLRAITGQKLIQYGYKVFTLKADKTPITYDRDGYSWKNIINKDLSIDDIENRVADPKAKYWAIATGIDGLEVVDVDLKVLPDSESRKQFWNEYLSFLKDNIDAFEEKILIYRTKNYGYHLIYKCEEPEGNLKIAKLKGSSEAIIETRGVGGYVVVYQDSETEKNYLQVSRITQEERDTIHAISKYFDYNEEEVKPDVKQIEPQQTGLSSWDDFNNKNTVFDVLGNEFDIIRQLNDKYIIRRSGAKSAHSGYVYKDSGCMYLFTTGTVYPSEKLLSPSAVYCYKNCSGDFSLMAKELYKNGYGDRIVKKVDKLSDEIEIDYSALEFPLDVFPKEIQHYIIECNKTLDSSIDYMGVSMIWLISVIIGNCFQVRVKNGWIESSVCWISVVGKPGLGKTPSINNIIRPIKKINSSEIKNYNKQIAKYKEFSELSQDEKQYHEEIKKPVKRQFIANDITIEALIDLHEESKNAVGVFKDELAGWYKDMNKYRAGSDLEFWLSSWSGDSVQVNRKTAKSNFVDSPHIPVLGGIQPGILTEFFTDQNKANGFVDRMLLCFPDLQIEKYNDNELDSDLIQWYDDYITQMYNLLSELIKYNDEREIEPYILDFSDDAKTEWKRVFDNITDVQNSDDENEYMKSMLPKQKSYIPRFALIIEIINRYNDTSDIEFITKDSLIKAEKLSNYFVAMAKKIKIDSIEVGEIKQHIYLNKDKTKKEQFYAVYKDNKDVNMTELANLLDVSRTILYKWKKEI